MDKFLAAYIVAGYLGDGDVEHAKTVAYQYVGWINAQASEAAAIQALLEAGTTNTNLDRVLDEADALLAADAPTASDISPATGTTLGGDTVTITGTKLLSVTGVTFGGTAATSVVASSDTTLTCVTPAKTAGAKDVVITTQGGSVTKTGFFTYVVVP